MASKRKAEEAEEAKIDATAAKSARFSGEPLPHQQLHHPESDDLITQTNAAKLNFETAEEENETKNVDVSKSGPLDESKNVPPKKIVFSGPWLPQQWPFRQSIIDYIIKNPTAKSHQKLILCCKYFFAKNPIFVIHDLKFEDGDWQTSTDDKPIDISKIAASKLWISGTFSVKSFTNHNILSSMISKISRCDIESLVLYAQIISYTDLIFIASSVDAFSSCQLTVKSDDDSIIPFEKIVAGLPKVKQFIFFCDPNTSTVNSLSWKELVKIPHFSQLPYFCLSNIPETFSLDAFYAYMKENKVTHFDLTFDHSISDTYKNQLERIVDEIIDTKPQDYKLPMIHFHGLDSSKFQKFLDVFCDWRTQMFNNRLSQLLNS